MFARPWLCLILLLPVVRLAPAADKPLVEPGRSFKAEDAQTTDTKLCVVGETLRIETGHKHAWPGVKLPAPGGRWDLSAFECVAL